ncbi:hypothetical protein ACHQM5_007867 [Ranunculus cassubicifolius]
MPEGVVEGPKQLTFSFKIWSKCISGQIATSTGYLVTASEGQMHTFRGGSNISSNSYALPTQFFMRFSVRHPAGLKVSD